MFLFVVSPFGSFAFAPLVWVLQKDFYTHTLVAQFTRGRWLQRNRSMTNHRHQNMCLLHKLVVQVEVIGDSVVDTTGIPIKVSLRCQIYLDTNLFEDFQKRFETK